MNIFDSVREKIDNFVSQKGKLAAIVIALLVAFFILGVAVMICTPSQKSKKRKQKNRRLTGAMRRCRLIGGQFFSCSIISCPSAF